MECPRCRTSNPDGTRFCEECGAPLSARACRACGAPVRTGKKFCGACGAALEHAEGSAEVAGTPAHAADAERRQLTVLFCDLVGSTALSARLDPEELREVVRAYQQACAEVIARFEGHVAQYLGDGLLVYFGYPAAHEDDAQRAVHAGLGIVEAMKPLRVCELIAWRRIGTTRNQVVAAHSIASFGIYSQTLSGRLPHGDRARLAVRVGIHTGLVVVGEVGGGPKHEQLALGETPNLAARLQALADLDTVVISAPTHRLLHGLFHTRDLGGHALKGVSTPVQVYQVLGESGAQSRLDAAATAGLTPLVGREQVGLLLDRWEQVTDGQGQVVLLSGEAGIGKSRLLQVVKERVAGAAHRRLECRCSPYYEHSPLYPVIDLLPRVLEWSREDTPDGRLGKLPGGMRCGDRTGRWAYRPVSRRRAPAYRAKIAELAAKRRLPATYNLGDYVDAGGLMSYGPSLTDRERRAATYVERILKGAKPGDLPVEQPMKYELVINLKTAKALGLTIPPPVLIRADKAFQ